jgi:hypothetical protein
MHLYLGESDVWVFTQFDTRPVMVPWITKACGMIFNGITEDDATYQRINEEMCNLVTGGYNERTKEAYLSWPSGDNACPDVTLRFNLKFSTADLVDHGFTAFQTFRKELRPTFGQWLEDLGVCERGTQVAMGPRDGPICAGTEDEVVNPPLYMRNPTEDASLPVHPDSLCARLQGKTLDDFCRDCAAPDTFIMASATDFTLKQWEDDFYYRERLAFLPVCSDVDFGNYYGLYYGFGQGEQHIMLDQWISLGSLPCGDVVATHIAGVDFGNGGAASPPPPPTFGSGIECDEPSGGLTGMPADITCAAFDAIRIAFGLPAVGAVAIVENGPVSYDYHSVGGADPLFIPRMGDIMEHAPCINLTPGTTFFLWTLVCNLNFGGAGNLGSALYQKQTTDASPKGTYYFAGGTNIAPQDWPATVEVT